MLLNHALVPAIRLSLLTAVLVLAACAKEENSELNWARAALERNPQIKVIAVDATKNTIQVRVKATGETLTLAPGELAAIPLGDLIVLTSARQTAPQASPQTSMNAPAPEPTPIVEPSPAEPPSVPTQPVKPEYTVQREDGRVRVTGPGVSIETHKSVAPENETAALGIDEPIICDGRRMLHLDNKRINVTGDAIVARGGCELHITNSHIRASGTGVTVLDANVHIVNSEIVGTEGSLTTSSAARVLLRNSQFTGLARRDTQASIQDQGGNTWR